MARPPSDRSMIYLVVKAAHIVAVVTWMGGMLASAIALAAARTLPPAELAQIALAVHRWDRQVTTPAMLATWVLGLTLAKLGAWFPAPWLIAKIALVSGLTALHGVQAGKLRRIANAGEGDVTARFFNGLWVLGAVAVIVVLVVLKPG